MEERERTAFAPSGHIVNQARMGGYRYGCRTSDVNGCGWIAVYNFLRCMGSTVRPENVADALSRHSLFRGLFGTSPFRIRRYLRRRGYALLSALGVKKAACAAAGAVSGILLYRHSGGWHFVAFARAEGENLHFYNAIAGAPNHVESMPSFLARQNLSRFVWLMYLPET